MLQYTIMQSASFIITNLNHFHALICQCTVRTWSCSLLVKLLAHFRECKRSGEHSEPVLTFPDVLVMPTLAWWQEYTSCRSCNFELYRHSNIIGAWWSFTSIAFPLGWRYYLLVASSFVIIFIRSVWCQNSKYYEDAGVDLINFKKSL